MAELLPFDTLDEPPGAGGTEAGELAGPPEVADLDAVVVPLAPDVAEGDCPDVVDAPQPVSTTVATIAATATIERLLETVIRLGIVIASFGCPGCSAGTMFARWAAGS